jgi:site-specific DNA recombinase
MKKAIGYIRISTKDQSNFSLPGQERYIREFAERHGYEVLNVFCDDGQSAKNFDRPDWKKLQSFCKQNFSQVDALIVAKYDRFSRNLKDALNMIEMLEDKFSIRILSAMEPIMIDTHSPFFFQFRTQMLMGAQVEWLVIKDRTKFGNYNGAKAGRFFTTAPFGYINKRDEGNKPIIVLDEAKAPVVRKMFAMCLQGASLKEIHLEAKRLGYKNKGNSAVKDTLSNPVYAGLIRIPSYGDDPGGWFTKGIHQGIIDEQSWHRAQHILQPRTAGRTVMNEEVPLRSVLKCFCGRCMTAGHSKGRNRHYWYYRCDTHTKFNHNADKLHAQLHELIRNLSLPDHYIEYLKDVTRQKLQVELKDKELLMQDKKRELAALNVKMDNVEEKFINDQLDPEAYKKWKHRYQVEIANCQQYLTDYSQPIDRIMSQYTEHMDKLGNLLYFYERADLHEKQSFIRQVFKSNLYYREGIYGTTYLLPVFLPNALILKEKRLLEIEQPSINTAKSQHCAPDQYSLEPLRPLLQLLAQIKVA